MSHERLRNFCLWNSKPSHELKQFRFDIYQAEHREIAIWCGKISVFIGNRTSCFDSSSCLHAFCVYFRRCWLIGSSFSLFSHSLTTFSIISEFSFLLFCDDLRIQLALSWTGINYRQLRFDYRKVLLSHAAKLFSSRKPRFDWQQNAALFNVRTSIKAPINPRIEQRQPQSYEPPFGFYSNYWFSDCGIFVRLKFVVDYFEDEETKSLCQAARKQKSFKTDFSQQPTFTAFAIITQRRSFFIYICVKNIVEWFKLWQRVELKLSREAPRLQSGELKKLYLSDHRPRRFNSIRDYFEGTKMLFTRYYFPLSLSRNVCLYQHATIKTLFALSASQLNERRQNNRRSFRQAFL